MKNNQANYTSPNVIVYHVQMSAVIADSATGQAGNYFNGGELGTGQDPED